MLTCACWSKHALWTTGSFNSVYALQISFLQANNSNLSVRPGMLRCLQTQQIWHITILLDTGHMYKKVNSTTFKWIFKNIPDNFQERLCATKWQYTLASFFITFYWGHYKLVHFKMKIDFENIKKQVKFKSILGYSSRNIKCKNLRWFACMKPQRDWLHSNLTVWQEWQIVSLITDWVHSPTIVAWTRRVLGHV